MRRGFAIAGACLGLAACATVVAPPPPPAAVMSYAPSVACSALVSVASAVALTPEEPVANLMKTANVDAAAPCLQAEGGEPRPYAVFAMPAAGRVASMSAGAVLERQRLFAPAVYTLGADGKVIRTFGESDFRHRGQTLAALFVPRPEEKFVLVAASPTKVGTSYSLVAGGAPSQADSVMGPQTLPFSYEGTVFARAYFADPSAP